MFVDVRLIEEDVIGGEGELEMEEVYFGLKKVGGGEMMKFMGGGKIGLMRYRGEGVDGKKVEIGEEVWEGGREEYMKGIERIVEYGKNDEIWG